MGGHVYVNDFKKFPVMGGHVYVNDFKKISQLWAVMSTLMTFF